MQIIFDVGRRYRVVRDPETVIPGRNLLYHRFKAGDVIELVTLEEDGVHDYRPIESEYKADQYVKPCDLEML